MIRPGDVQWMTAGRGLIHNEIPAEGVVVHSLQLWVNLPAADKMTAPRYQDLAGDAVPVRREPGAEVRVFSGSSGGVTAPTTNFVPVTMVEFRLEPAAWVRQDLPADYNAVVVVLEGVGALGKEGAPVKAGDVAWLTRGEDASPSEAAIQAGDKPLRALLYAGRPLREPVVAGGPFCHEHRGPDRRGLRRLSRRALRSGLTAGNAVHAGLRRRPSSGPLPTRKRFSRHRRARRRRSSPISASTVGPAALRSSRRDWTSSRFRAASSSSRPSLALRTADFSTSIVRS